MKKLLIFVFVCLMTSVVYADKPFKFIFFEDVSNDDNIYLTNEDKKSSIISSTQLFLQYLNSIPNTSLKFGADVNVGYNAYTESSSKNNYFNTGIGLKLNNDKFFLDEKFLYTADPATSELTERAKRFNNTASFRFKTSLEKLFSIGFLVSDIYDKYEEKKYDQLNRNRINAGAQLYYNVSSRTSFYLGYIFSKIAYEKREDCDSLGNSFNLGVNGNISRKIKGTAQVSYDMRHYEKEIENSETDANIFGYLVSLTYEHEDRTSVSLIGERKMEEAIFGNNRYYISTEAGIEYKQQIYKKWKFGIFASYENIGYPEKVNDVKRTDDLLKVKPSIEYKFKEFLFASVWYQFRNKTSKVETAEYANNKVGVQVKLSF